MPLRDIVKPQIDMPYLLDVLEALIRIPSPTGFTDRAAMFACRELDRLAVPYEMTRRGAIRGTIEGARHSPDRAMVAHLDTLGAQVCELKENGRLRLAPVGHWSARFAEGARVSLFTDDMVFRGQILPLKASGHAFNEEIDTLPVGWEYVELRIDAQAESKADLKKLGVNPGDFVAIDPGFEFIDTGYIASRHLDNKAGCACLFAAVKAMRDHDLQIPYDCHPLFTISEEVGSGASGVMQGDVSEMVTIDNGVTAPGQNSRETGLTIAMRDMTGPFDYHLTHKLLRLAREHRIPHQRDVFIHYRSDSAAAIDAGADIRTALITFGIDASHGYERIHISALKAVAEMAALYMQSPLTAKRDSAPLASVEGFPEGQGAHDPGPPPEDDMLTS